MTPKVSDKELRAVATDAERRGWNLGVGGGGHHKLTNGHHRITVASSPSDSNAYKNFARRIGKCEAGTCEHGMPAAQVTAKVDGREARMLAAQERLDRAALRAAEKAMLTTTTPVGATVATATKEPRKMTTKTKRRSREAAEKWARWMASRGGEMTHPKVIAELEKAGHSWAAARSALIAAGAVQVARGRGKTPLWRFPGVISVTEAGAGSSITSDANVPASEGGQATVHAPSPVSSGESLTELAVEWARLEGMVAMLGHGSLVEQVAKVKEMVEHG